MSSKEALLILGDQLFSPEHFKPFQGMPAFMCEDYGLCTHFRYHKLKIALFLSAMRNFADNPKIKALVKITYHRLSAKIDRNKDFFSRLKDFTEENKITTLHCFEIEDKFFETSVQKFCDKNKITIQTHRTPAFLFSRDDFKTYLKSVRKPFMKTFYERQRKQTGILMTKAKTPVGGQYSFDEENRKPYKNETPVPELKKTKTSIRKDVIDLINTHFTDHPGELTEFIYPTTHQDARSWLKSFIAHRLEHFGRYEDAIHSEHPFLFHSVLSPMMNTGLLTPKEVIDAALSAYEEGRVPLNSVEGFVRQVMGWREFIRGIYRNFSDELEERNFWNHHRKLGREWYDGSTGLPPVDDAIKKVTRYGYLHHIERLMIISNTMLLSGIHPKEAHRWFMEMFIDSADWVMAPNVYGMGLFSDGGIFATKPYICGSNYWLKMSNYKKGPWCEKIDQLFWNFIGEHRNFFLKNPRLSMMVRTYDKMKSKGSIKSLEEK